MKGKVRRGGEIKRKGRRRTNRRKGKEMSRKRKGKESKERVKAAY